ncbi:MAG TPA: adenylate/guanylate cyclase domain-containing protein, partial [Spirochaetota bacterium]|nr:adenylate/guanylate cyclase domain-containing protein [Spirochaetota bacterium]
MFKILYIGSKEKFNIDIISSEISNLSGSEIGFVREDEVEFGMPHFFDAEPIMLFLIEEGVIGCEDFITSIKEDESFLYLPIILVLEQNNQEKRKKYYAKGINNFLHSGFDEEELCLTCNSALRNKIKLDEVLKQLSDVSEMNITKAIQLDLLRKFIPMTVWEKTETLAEGQDLEIPEEEQEIAILFGDLQSFTTISELLTPKEVIQMLNGVFHVVTQIIYQNFGDIDKFIGDAFLAVFKHPEMALLSALAIQTSLKFYNELRIKDGQPVVNFRMGINWGKVIRGSVGGTS